MTARPTRSAVLSTVPDVPGAARAVLARLAARLGLPAPLPVDHEAATLVRDACDRADLGDLPFEAVGWLHERSLGEQRGAVGAWFTPTELVDVVLDAALDATVSTPRRVLDPACGTGAFLLAALDRLVADGRDRAEVAAGLHGADVDAEAVALCRALLWLAVGDPDLPTDAFDARVVHGDSLTAPLGEPLDAAVVAAAVDSTPLARPAVDWHAMTGEGDEPFDLVVGNPPYLRGRTHAQLDPPHRRHVTRLHATAHGSTWNLWVPFVERALALARGPVALLVPSALLGAGYVARLHAHLRDHAVVHAVHDLSTVGGFDDAAVHTAFVVASPRGVRPAQVPTRRQVAFVRHERTDDGGLGATTRHRPSSDLAALPDGFWTLPFAGLDDDEVEAFLHPTTVLDDLVEVRDGMEQDQAYAVRELVVEAEDAGTDDVVRLVTTGAIDPGRTTWGERPVRFLGTSHHRPVVRRDALRAAFPDLAVRAARPKVAVAGLARRLEAVADLEGALLVGKSAMLVTARDGTARTGAREDAAGEDVTAAARALLDDVAELLNAPATTRLYRAAFGGLGFGGGSFNVRPPALRRLPVPAWVRAPRQTVRPVT